MPVVGLVKAGVVDSFATEIAGTRDIAALQDAENQVTNSQARFASVSAGCNCWTDSALVPKDEDFWRNLH